MEEQKKIPLVIFSGGLDSTFMLYEYLQETDVDVLYVKGHIGEDKIAKELEARREIIKRLHENMPGVKYKVKKQLEVETGFLFGSDVEAVGFSQLPMWLVGALQKLQPDRHSHIAIGYIAGDQIAHRLPYIEKAWEYLQRACGSRAYAEDSFIPVRFPLKSYRKLEILEQIPKEVVQHVWVCEMPVWWRNGEKVWDGKAGGQLKACGKCPACLTMAGTLEMYKRKHDEPYSHAFIRYHQGLTKEEAAPIKEHHDLTQDQEIRESIVCISDPLSHAPQ